MFSYTIIVNTCLLLLGKINNTTTLLCSKDLWKQDLLFLNHFLNKALKFPFDFSLIYYVGGPLLCERCGKLVSFKMIDSIYLLTVLAQKSQVSKERLQVYLSNFHYLRHALF